ncbi:ankyrin repeat-containing domain protein [Aspergillus spinulosporus]
MSSSISPRSIIDFLGNTDIADECSRQICALNGARYESDAKQCGMTDMHLAAYFGLYDALKALILARGDRSWFQQLLDAIRSDKVHYLSPKDDFGRTPLSYAAENGHYDVVDLLLDKGVATDQADKNGRTPLSWAAEAGNFDIVSELLQHGASVMTRDNFNRTPLLFAAASGHSHVVGTLLWHCFVFEEHTSGVIDTAAKDCSTKDDHYTCEDCPSGGTPLVWASSNGHISVVEALLEEKRFDDSDRRESSSRPFMGCWKWPYRGGKDSVGQGSIS